jgi:3-oxoacyl-[acyl-carrier-protein] synthase-3
VVENSDLTQFADADRKKIIDTTGIQRRRKSPPGLCTSDLCFEAARDVLASAQVDISEIGLIVFVSQTPDYVLPATSILLAGRLGATKDCAAFDVNLGCSGYVYGLWQTASLLRTLGAAKALLLVGDSSTQLVSEEDRSAVALFGDCGTATLLSLDDAAEPMVFDMGSDGGGAEHLIVRTGGFRHRPTAESLERAVGKDGNRRASTELFMDGPQVFNFAVREVPKSIRTVLDAADTRVEDVEAAVFHQANRMMLDYLAKRVGLNQEVMRYSIAEYGNTSSATVPLTIVAAMADEVSSGPIKTLVSGFGVGWSWASAVLSLGPMPRPTLREI